MKLIFVGLLCVILGNCEYASYRTSNQRVEYNPRNDLEWAGYSYSIDEGSCSGIKVVDEEVQKDAQPYAYHKTAYKWDGRGMITLTCIRVLNRMPRDQHAAEARISEGGIGQGHVRLEMRSKDSQRIHYHVEMWGKETRPQGSNVAILTHSPSDILYMGGKKYCECR